MTTETARRELFFTAVHETGHGFVAIRHNVRQRVDMELIVRENEVSDSRYRFTYEGWCRPDRFSPSGLMGGMAAELVFGNSWQSAYTCAAGDLAIFRELWPRRDWRPALQQAVQLLSCWRTEVAAAALLLLRYRTITQDDLLECCKDPRRTLQANRAGFLGADRPAQPAETRWLWPDLPDLGPNLVQVAK